ncbi:response regulator [Skermanella aerolata]|uniref:Response regulator n=1 Tax=Skermanella aerolata TaxID=393310 RepID=A0A512E2P8_9PROT|nr:response regulator [Skermanella aerolata]KJB90082.1 histidine kinase [Skermanella aerolata KACC 11604]GEO43001.1 response regulator [Skermanella aerolata]
MTTHNLAGCRILVVEDELLIAVMIEEALQDLGCVVVGPAAKLDDALRLAREETLDGAVLDVTIRGGRVYPVTECLRARGIPFVLASGYGDWALPEDLQDHARLTKPFTADELEKHISLLCGGRG